jgi:2-polyprenyl-3-methyl-5-hydroxy-6-metoxy-1,4-benzoquinol methylase
MESSVIPGLESVTCNLCGANQTRPFASRKGMQIVQCQGCGLVYVNPRLNRDSLHRHYNQGESSRIQYYQDVECADRRTFAGILDLAERLMPGRGQLLDVGPNIGTCLDLARQRGWDVCGIEINATAADYCRTKRGLHVVTGTLDHHGFAPSSFDVVLMGDVIEHLCDPVETMRVVQELLRPAGVVIISTPNIATWSGRLLQLKPQEHLYYFSPATMTTLLQQVGLEVVQIQPLDRFHNLTAMTHSTTFGGLFRVLGPLFRLSHWLVGDLVLRLPLRENLLAVGRKPAQVLAEAA